MAELPEGPTDDLTSSPAAARNESCEEEIPPEKWQALDAVLEGHTGSGSEHRCVPPQHGWPTGRNGSRVQEVVGGRRKTPCPASRRGSMEQGQEPHSLRPAESARVHPPCHLGDGPYPNGRGLQNSSGTTLSRGSRFPRWTKCGSSWNTCRKTVRSYSRQGNAVYQECRGITGRDSEGLEHAPEECGRQRAQETGRQAPKGQALLNIATLGRCRWADISRAPFLAGCTNSARRRTAPTPLPPRS